MKAVNVYLNFNGNTEEAFNFYRSVFGGEFEGGIMRFGDMAASGEMGDMGEVPEDARDKVAHVGLPLGDDAYLMGTDACESMGQSVTMGSNLYITLETDSEEEAGRLFRSLSDGGEVEMPLQETGWADKYGSCTDPFGVKWMVNYTGGKEFGGGAENG